MATELLYLDFDFSDEADGRGSFDAMASVLPDRVAALQAEIADVLTWAGRLFGQAGDDDAEWGYDLQTLESDSDGRRTTVTLTITGSPAFCEAFREEFNPAS